ADGREARASGWGYLFGDEGSAYAIGRAALQAASRTADGRNGPTSLLGKIPTYFKLPTFHDVWQAVYTPAITRPQIAGLAAVVTSTAREGDRVALALLEQAGHELALAALAVISALAMREAGMSVYTTGGVFRAGDL